MKKFTTLIKPQSEVRKMKRFMVLIVLVAMAAIMLPAMAWAQTWTMKYDADALPTSPWTKFGSATPSASGGVLTLPNYSGYKNKDVNFTSGTVEVRLKASGGNPAIFFRNNNYKCASLNISWNGTGYLRGASFTYFDVNATTFHTYRITVTDTQVRLYIDGVLRVQDTPLTEGDPFNAQCIELSQDGDACSYYDYCYFTGSGVYYPPNPSPSQIGSDGYFYLNGTKTIMKGIEEERSILSDAQVNALIPKLKDMGINFMVIYEMNMQRPYFYQQMEANGIWISQHVGTAKKEMYRLSGTGGIIGETPDDAWYQQQMARLTTVVNTLKGYNNILFWWMGGEFVEPWINDAEGRATIRNHVAGYRDAIRALDPMGRPFTVSHHYLEASRYQDDPIGNPYIYYNDLTDLTWFTAVTHMHSCDFVGGTGWYPLYEVPSGFDNWGPLKAEGAITAALNTGVYLNDGKPIFMGGIYGNAPASGQCQLNDQYQLMWDKWNLVKNVLYNGYSTYHLSQWDGNMIPHRMMDWNSDWNEWALLPAGMALKEIANGAVFSDVPTTHWAYPYIMCLYNNGIISGYGDGTFGPDDNLTRAQAAKMIIRVENLTYTGGLTDFSDVPPSHWAYQFIMAARQNNIVNGYPDGTFGPEDNVTRAQIATMIVRAENLTYTGGLTDFPDVPPTHWAYQFIMAAKQNNIVNGYGDGTFGPENLVTRAEISAMLARVIGCGSKSSTEITDTTGVTDITEPVPEGYTLLLYPNPFSSSITIEYNLPKANNVSLAVYNIAGQVVTTLVNEQKPEGKHSVQWNGKDANGSELANGIYYCKIVTGEVTQTKKMMLMKE